MVFGRSARAGPQSIVVYPPRRRFLRQNARVYYIEEIARNRKIDVESKFSTGKST